MSAIKQAILLTMSVLAAYLYLQVPFLKEYFLQAFALSSAVYLFLQKQQRGYSALFLANHSVLGLAIINFAFLLLVGASGSLASPFFALTFIELFFVALSTSAKNTLLLSLEIMVFHFSLSIANSNHFRLETAQLSNLLALPIVSIFYLFAKNQYEKAYRNHLLLDWQNRELERAQSDDQAVAEFVTSLLNRRLPMLEFLLSFPEKNQAAILAEIQILKQDLNLLIRQIEKKTESSNSDQSLILKQEEAKTPNMEALIDLVEKESHEEKKSP